tara:strand:+ start:473 stop:1543 length:1071 start_codon:yes stop_codon:yes gene_type:complete
MYLTGSGSTRLELDGGKLISDSSDSYQIVTLHPDLPSKTTADSFDGLGNSSFLLQRDLLGDRFQEFNERLRMFRSVTDNDWVAFRRWFGYYLDKNREQFDREGEKLLDKAWKRLRGEFDRHHVIHFTLELFTAPLMVETFFLKMKEDIAIVYTSAIDTSAPVLKQFANDHLQDVINLLRDLFHCLELYIDNRSSILPGLAVGMYKHGEEAAQRDLHVLRDDFPRLRDLYLATFEAVHHSLEFVMALANIDARKDPDAFPAGGPKNLKKFSKLVNGEKAKVLGTMKAWQHHWSTIFDRSVRNAIGHHSVRHDLPSGMLISRDNAPVPYLVFVAKTIRLIHPILAAETTLKYLRMAAI